MNKINTSSRRVFIGNMSAGALGLALSAGFGKNSGITGQPDSEPAPLSGYQFPDRNDKKFVPVMVTPFASDSKIDFAVLSKLIDFYLAAGARGFFANCLSSEMFNLDEEERLALARHVVKHVNGAVPVVATGSFGKSPEEKAEFAKKIYHTGINAVILITGHFAGREETDEKLIRNFETFFSLTDNIPVGTYECPSPYKRILSPAVFRHLLDTNRVIYHKDTTLDTEKIRVKLELAKNSRLELYDAHTPNALKSLQLGAKGLSAIAGNFYPEILVWMCNNATNPGQQEQVKWLQAELTKVDAIVSDSYPMSSKYFLQQRGIPIQLVSRSSPASLTTKQKQALDEVSVTLKEWQERLGIKPLSF